MTDSLISSSSSPRYIDLRRLHQFVIAVDSPSLRVAAEQLFVTQQGLSASLRQLEADLNLELFVRTNRTLRVSPAGAELYRRAPALLAGGRSALTAVHRIVEEAPPLYVIGHTPDISGEEVHQILAPHLPALSGQPFRVAEVYPDRIRQELLEGRIDLALRRTIDRSLDLDSRVIAYHILRLAVSSRHPLAARSEVSIADLADFPVVVGEPEHRSLYTDYLVALCHREGFQPQLVTNPIQGTPPSTIIASSTTKCAFVTDPTGLTYGGQLRVIDFDDPPKVPVQAVWLPHTASPVRDRLVKDAAD
ncbi:LysR family transcriptional regulator [Gordonia sp. NPDC003376]